VHAKSSFIRAMMWLNYECCSFAKRFITLFNHTCGGSRVDRGGCLLSVCQVTVHQRHGVAVVLDLCGHGLDGVSRIVHLPVCGEQEGAIVSSICGHVSTEDDLHASVMAESG